MAWVTGAPLEMSEDLMTTFNISLVVRGTISETSLDRKAESSSQQRYSAPKASNMFRQASASTQYLVCMPCVVLITSGWQIKGVPWRNAKLIVMTLCKLNLQHCLASSAYQ